jgi:hypothetical protein
LITEDILVDEIRRDGDAKQKDTSDDIPFELKDDEAVIVYQINGRDYYYKVSNIEKKETIYYP